MLQATGKRVALFGSLASSLINFRGPLIRELVRRGHTVFALAPAIDPGTEAELRALGATPVEVTLGRTSLNPMEALRTVGQLRSVLRQIKPDVMIAYTIKPVTLGASAAHAEGVRFVPLVTGLGYAFTAGREAKRRLINIMARILYRRAFGRSQIAIFQNKDDLADFRKLGLLPATLPTAVINGSGIDLDRFRQVPVPDGVSFLMIARFLGDKGIREYAAAGRQLKALHPDVRVSLVGDLDPSPDSISREELDEIVRGGIELIGRLEDVRPALADHSVYVLPSYREGTPRSVLEALAVGRAVITTDAPGCRETVIENENGMLVPPKDSDALLAAMLRFVEQPELARRMGLASRSLAERKFDVHRVNEALLGHARL